ncbi:uncharacterized protein [Panulirus ornatus]|uniref:uncharacterized protein isoform X2 n=1 Tax=Panulirus ornatus TaxID=150431 RepID=UPI003A8A95A1
MDMTSIDSFWSEGRRESSWSSVRGRPIHKLHDPLPVLDLDALQVALTRLDHSHQKGKASVGRSGALSNRRPPSRGSRNSKRSSADSLQLALDHQDLEVVDLEEETPRVVNIEVHLDGGEAAEEHGVEREFTRKDFKEHSLSFREELGDELQKRQVKQQVRQEGERRQNSIEARQEIRRRLLQNRYRRSGASVGGSNPLLNNFSTEAEESFRRIKEEVARLAAKRRSSSDISDSRAPSDSTRDDQRSDSFRRWSEDRESLFDSASVLLDRNAEDNRSSSEADFVISDRESIADSGLVNRRTVITISEKKSKSATNLNPEDSTPLWIRDLQTRRSLRGKDQAPSRIVPIHLDPEFDGGINVSIVNQAEPNRKDSTSRMYVRQSDSENRPSRASAFNVRRTIEKRQIQQERRERRALREQIREQLRSLSEGRERKDSSGSHVSSVHLSQNSVRSKSMSSLDQDQDSSRSESPLFKVQSSPTLEKEKDEVRSYLFGVSNLTETGECSRDMSPTSRDETQVTRRESTEANSQDTVHVCQKTFIFERPETWQWTQSWDSLKTPQERADQGNSRKVSKSVDSVQTSPDLGSRHSSIQSSVLSVGSSKSSWRDHKLRQTEYGTRLFSPVQNTPIGSLESSTSCPPALSVPDTATAKRDSLPPLSEGLPSSDPHPIPPPRRNKLSRSTGQITLEEEEKPNWIRLAKERRSLRTAKQVDQLSDRASTASKEPEWVARARKKLESLNVTLTSTTDFNSASSYVTESSSAWSRGGLDALDDLKEEASRIGDELAEEAITRVNEDLGLHKDTSRMLEHSKERSREPSAERPRVSFDTFAAEASDGDSSRRSRSRRPQKDEVRFGDLKHDWGGAQTKATKASNGKQKEMRFGEIQVKETFPDPSERSKETRFGDHVPPTQKSSSNSSSGNGKRPVMRFGDTPLNLFPASEPKGPQSSSKFESVAGPDPTKMTAEQLNQNVEEYDFPIPTGKEDASELMRFLEESLKKTEIVPEVVCAEDNRPKPKGILKRRSVENVLHELKREERSEWLQKVEHQKSASFDWDSVEEEQLSSTSTTSSTEYGNTPTTSTERNEAPQVLHSSNSSPQPPISSSSSVVTTSSSSSSRSETREPTKPPAKIFSFTFSADQKTRPETTFRELEEDTLVHLKTQKEVENIRRTEGMKTLTLITNPSDVHRHNHHPHPSAKAHSNGHAIMSMASCVELNKSKSVKIGSHDNDAIGEQLLPRSAEVLSKAFGTKLVTQSTSSSGGMHKSEDKFVEETSKHKVHQVKVEVVGDEEQRQISLRKKEERRRSSLLEWEAIQRQRLEDEEKNRINKNLSMKPVSTKIKELVKMHGSFMSMFSKDKKTDINGTVDGKDDIVFRKISSENLHSIPKTESVKETSVAMKSPYMVKKLLSPQRNPSPHDEPQRLSRRASSKTHSPNRKSSNPTTQKEASKSRPSSDRREHPAHRILTENNWKNSAVQREVSGTSSQKGRPSNTSSSSSSSSRLRKSSSKTSSPERTASNRGKDVPPPPLSSEIFTDEVKVSESKPRLKEGGGGGDSSKYSRKVSPPVPPKPHNLHEKSQAYPSPYLEMKRRESSKHVNERDKYNSQTSFSHVKRTSEGRSSIKDPKNRKEWLNKMLNTLSSDHIPNLEKPNSPETATFPLTQSKIHQDRTKYSENIYTEDDPSEKLNGFTSPVPPMRRCTPSSSKIFNDQLQSALMKYSSTTTTTSTASSSPSPKPSSSNPTVSSTQPLLSSKLVSPHFTKQCVDPTDASCSFKSNPSLPSTPTTSLRFSVRESLQSDQFQAMNERRGPVSLSSILGDCSSRSSSMTSTPLTSPRATPERVIKKESHDLASRLGVILESSLRDEQRVRLPGEEQKENIAPSPGTRTESLETDTEEDESTNPIMSSSLRSSSRLKDRSEERKKGLKMNYAETSPQKESNGSWQPSPYKPFTFAKPSVTIKTMTLGVDPHRVATFNTPHLHKEDKPDPMYLTSSTFSSLRESRNVNCVPDKKKFSLERSEYSESREPFPSRYTHEKSPSQKRFSESLAWGVTDSNCTMDEDDRQFPSSAHEPFVSNYFKERPSRSGETSERSTPEKDARPVSLSSILSREVKPKGSVAEEPEGFQFKPNLSFSEELNDMTRKYCKDMANHQPPSEETDEDTSCTQVPTATNYDSDEVFDNDPVPDEADKKRDSSLEPRSKESSPVRDHRRASNVKPDRKKPAKPKPPKEMLSSPSAPKGLPRTSSTSSGKSRHLVVRRNSSLKRNRSQDAAGSTKLKKERKDSEEDQDDLKDETFVQDAAGWTKTKTTVRRARLGSSEKSRQIVRSNSGKSRKERVFKANASKALEDWAAGTDVQGKLMKKEGQRFTHETEEEVKGGQRTSKSVVRRVVRRGSRKLSGGGELLTETKETSSTGVTQGGGEKSEPTPRALPAPDDGLSRKMKTSTDGERYMTQSVSDKDGKTTYTTEGVNNKTTNSLEVIGGEDFNAKREVQGKTGHRVVVECSKDNLGRPSTVVKKITSQSRVVITKTKRKLPVMV